MKILTALLFVSLLSCSQDKANDAERSCSLYARSYNGLTIKVASVKEELVGGTPGQQATVERKDDADSYANYQLCLGLTELDKASWCECSRGNQRAFEDEQVRDGMKVVWTEGK